MKKIVKVCALALLTTMVAPSLTACQGAGKVLDCLNKDSIDVFNWGSYIDPDVIERFEQENGVCVNYSTFNSNESAVEKLKKNEVYDIIFPSEYAVEELVAEDLLQPIDWSKITSISNNLVIGNNGINDIEDEVKSIINDMKTSANPFDFTTYAVPYFWGSVGIVYDTTKVSAADLVAKQWDILQDKRFTVGYYDSSRDGFMIPLKQLGYSMNTTNQSEVDAAETWLKTQKAVLGNNISYVGDDVIEDMAASNNRYDMAVVYSGDATYMMAENSKLNFYKPTIGTNVWLDGMVIHKQSTKLDLVYKFINHMMEDESAKANSVFVGYSSVKAKAYQEICAEDYADQVAAYKVVYNRQVDEVFRFNKASKRMIDNGWANAKLA